GRRRGQRLAGLRRRHQRLPAGGDGARGRGDRGGRAALPAHPAHLADHLRRPDADAARDLDAGAVPHPDGDQPRLRRHVRHLHHGAPGAVDLLDDRGRAARGGVAPRPRRAARARPTCRHRPRGRGPRRLSRPPSRSCTFARTPGKCASMKTSTFLALAFLLGCGGSGGDGGPAGDGGPTGPDSGSPSGRDAGDGETCARTPAAADRTRHAIVSHPYTDGGDPREDWEVLALSPEGELTATGMTFAMGRGSFGRAVFTADGAIAVAAQHDGTLGIVEIGPGGEPRVVERAWNGGGAFHAASVEMAPDSRRVYVLDSQ